MLLSRKLLDPDQTLTEVQKFSAGKIPPLPAATNVTDWELRYYLPYY